MLKTTVYLPEEAKHSLEEIARLENVKEAELIRQAVDRFIAEKRRPKPTIPLFRSGLPGIARNPKDKLDGFGE